MKYSTLDRLLQEPPKKLIISLNGNDTVCSTNELHREGVQLIRETKDIVQIYPINQIFITHLKV